MLGQTFVYQANPFYINELRRHQYLEDDPENPSESLVEYGLRHPGGKTFRNREGRKLRQLRELRL